MTSPSADGATVVLPKVLDVRAAPALASELLKMRGGDISVDASQVERLGAQCLQVLLSAQATWRSDGCVLTFTQISEGLAEGLQLLGFSSNTLASMDRPA